MAPLVGTQPKPEEVNKRIEVAQQGLTTATQSLEQAQRTDDVSERGLNSIGFIRKIAGKRSETEAADQVANAQADLNKATQAKTQAESDLEAATTYKPEYIAKQTGQRAQELIEANKRGGPMGVSAEMTRALSMQDKLQEQIRFYKEKSYDAPSDKLLPLDIYLKVKSALEQQDPRSGMRAEKEDIEKRLVAVSAVNEVALEYADKEHIQLDEKTYAGAVSAGLRITDGIFDGSGLRFVENKRGKRTSTNDVGYYAVGASQLQEFFRRNNITDGEARVPYVLGYAAGVVANGVPGNLGGIVRDWLTDTMPCEWTKRIRKDGQWVDEPQPTKPRGLGSLITENDAYYSFALQREGTTDAGLVNVMKKAGIIARSIDRKLRERRTDYQIINEFNIATVQNPALILLPNQIRT